MFETEEDGQDYRIALTALPGKDGNQQADQRGRYKAILVNDLPLKSNGQMRIIFELTGPGEVWLDNVKLNDVLFSLSFYEKSQDRKSCSSMRRTRESTKCVQCWPAKRLPATNGRLLAQICAGVHGRPTRRK